MNDWQTIAFNCQLIKTHALFTWFEWHLTQNGGRKPRWAWAHFYIYRRGSQLSACVNVSSVVNKDTKNKQTNKVEQLRDKLGFVQIAFPFLHRFKFLLSVFVFCFTFRRHCHCTKSAILQIIVCCDFTLVWRVKERVCRREFAVWTVTQ